MAVVTIRCSCGEKIRLYTDRKSAAVFHAHFGRTIECDGRCRKTETVSGPDLACAELQPRTAAGPLAAAFA